MTRRVEALTPDTLADLPGVVRGCLHWELDPVARARAVRRGDAESIKAAWVGEQLADWGTCGRVLYVDDTVAGFVLYGPASAFRGTASYAVAPLSEDAVQLATGEVFEEFRGAGLGRLLVHAMLRDLLRRGHCRAVEAVATCRDEQCLLPQGFLTEVGFATSRSHPRQPRMRLDLRSVATWREEVESAVGRLMGAVRHPRPVPTPRSADLGSGSDVPA